LPALSPPHIFPLSLHDALPILSMGDMTLTEPGRDGDGDGDQLCLFVYCCCWQPGTATTALYCRTDDSYRRNGKRHYVFRLSGTRSEEHTSELQSRFDLVCRLLL